MTSDLAPGSVEFSGSEFGWTRLVLGTRLVCYRSIAAAAWRLCATELPIEATTVAGMKRFDP